MVTPGPPSTLTVVKSSRPVVGYVVAPSTASSGLPSMFPRMFVAGPGDMTTIREPDEGQSSREGDGEEGGGEQRGGEQAGAEGRAAAPGRQPSLRTVSVRVPGITRVAAVRDDVGVRPAHGVPTHSDDPSARC